MDSKELEVKLDKIVVIPLQTTNSKGSKKSDRKSLLSGVLGKIKNLGLLQKTIHKMLFCMKEDSRLGVFFLVTTTQEMVGVLSEASTIFMMIKTGFSVEGLLLLLLKVVLNCVFLFFFINLNLPIVPWGDGLPSTDPRTEVIRNHFGTLEMDFTAGLLCPVSAASTRKLS